MFNLILEDTNIGADKTKYLSERKVLVSQLELQETLIAKARKLFVEDKLKFDDFREFKKDYQGISGVLQKEFNAFVRKLKRLDQQTGSTPGEIFHMFQFMDIADKKQLISLLPPSAVDVRTGEVFININSALARIVHHKH